MNVLATIEAPAFDERLLVAKYSATWHFTSSPKPATAAANVTLEFLGLGLTWRAVDRDLLAWPCSSVWIRCGQSGTDRTCGHNGMLPTWMGHPWNTSVQCRFLRLEPGFANPTSPLRLR